MADGSSSTDFHEGCGLLRVTLLPCFHLHSCEVWVSACHDKRLRPFDLLIAAPHHHRRRIDRGHRKVLGSHIQQRDHPCTNHMPSPNHHPRLVYWDRFRGGSRRARRIKTDFLWLAGLDEVSDIQKLRIIVFLCSASTRAFRTRHSHVCWCDVSSSAGRRTSGIPGCSRKFPGP